LILFEFKASVFSHEVVEQFKSSSAHFGAAFVRAFSAVGCHPRLFKLRPFRAFLKERAVFKT